MPSEIFGRPAHAPTSAIPSSPSKPLAPSRVGPLEPSVLASLGEVPRKMQTDPCGHFFGEGMQAVETPQGLYGSSWGGLAGRRRVIQRRAHRADLRRAAPVASSMMLLERGWPHTLSGTAVVHEAVIRLRWARRSSTGRQDRSFPFPRTRAGERGGAHRPRPAAGRRPPRRGHAASRPDSWLGGLLRGAGAGCARRGVHEGAGSAGRAGRGQAQVMTCGTSAG